MKIVIVNQDVISAAELGVELDSVLNIDLFQCDTPVKCKELDEANLVIGDPAPYPTKVWIKFFRSNYPNTPLILLSTTPDLISGSFEDKCFAMTKPHSAKELVEVIKVSVAGNKYIESLSSNLKAVH